MSELDYGLTVLLCNGWGAALKKSTLPDWLIPIVLGFVGSLVYCLLTDFTGRGAVYGASAGIGSVGTHQILKQLQHRKDPA